jgi:Zn-dependent protease
MFAIRLGALLLLTFGGLSLLMYPDLGAAGVITGLGALVATLWYVITQRRKAMIEVDDESIRRIDAEGILRIRWVDVREVTTGETLIPTRSGVIPVRFGLVCGMGNQKIAFADLTFIDGQPLAIGAPGPLLITDVAQSEILMAIAADKIQDEALLPTDEPDDVEDYGAAEDNDDQATPSGERRLRVGMLTLLIKLGAKAIKPILGLFKGTQGILALASVGVLAMLFSWEGALAIVGMLLFHEYGHVHAMRRSGIPVRGIYFIPLLGAAAVADDIWRTRKQQAYIALSGPFWGAALTLVPVAVLAFTGDRYPLVAGIAAMWALINFFNLLPINPLDGGRVLSAVSYSISSTLGLVLSLGTLLVGVGLAFSAGLHLFALLGVVGLVEMSAERSAATRNRRLAFTEGANRFRPKDLARYRLLTRPAFPDESEDRLRQVELARFTRMAKLASIEPMTPGQSALWFGLYLLLSGGLAAIMFWIASIHPDLSTLLDILR